MNWICQARQRQILLEKWESIIQDSNQAGLNCAELFPVSEIPLVTVDDSEDVTRLISVVILSCVEETEEEAVHCSQRLRRHCHWSSSWHHCSSCAPVQPDQRYQQQQSRSVNNNHCVSPALVNTWWSWSAINHCYRLPPLRHLTLTSRHLFHRIHWIYSLLQY